MFGCGDPTKKRGMFVAITAVSRIYEGYEDPSMSDEDRQRLYRVVKSGANFATTC